MTDGIIKCNWKHYLALEDIVTRGGSGPSVVLEDNIGFRGRSKTHSSPESPLGPTPTNHTYHSVAEALRRYESQLPLNYDLLFDSDIWPVDTRSVDLLHGIHVYRKGIHFCTSAAF